MFKKSIGLMKAIVYTRYGSPEVLRLKEIETPVANDNEVLVKIKAAALNPADWHIIRGKPWLARLSTGLFRPKNTVPGMDMSGVVVKVGGNVTEFKPGDEVFGECGWGGALAEYAAVPVKNLVLKPVNVSFEEAATANVAAITALQGLRYKKNNEPEQEVLINGASGGVGTFAVQIAHITGVRITGVCSARNATLVRSLGAVEVVDYTSQDFARQEQKYDFIFDAIGNRSVKDYMRALAPNGTCIIIGFTTFRRLFEHMILGKILSLVRGKSVVVMGTARVNKADLETLKDLMASGKIRPVIDRTYPLSETAAAVDYLEQGHARGKVIIQV